MERTEEQHQRFAAALGTLAECFGEPVSSGRLASYFEALVDLPIAAVERAIAAAIRTQTFFPKPVELRRLAGAEGPDVGEAYAELGLALRSYSPYGRELPVVSPHLDLIVQRMGGWRTITLMSEEEQWRRFRALWEPVRLACATRGVFLPAPDDDEPRRLT